jgi:hypothetical protein
MRSTQPLTEINTRNIPRVKRGRPAREAKNLIVICEPTVYKTWGLDVSQPDRPLRPVAGTAFLLILISVRLLVKTFKIFLY